MFMIRKTVIAAACLIAASAAHAQLGGLGSMLGGVKNAVPSANAGGDIATEVATFVSKSGALSTIASNSVTAINAAFSSDEDIAKKRASLLAINQVTDPKEKEAKKAALYESESAEAKRRLDSGDMEKQIGSLDAAKKKMIGDALLNFGIGSLQAVDLTRTGQSLLTKAGANPMNIGKILPVKDALPLLGKVASDSGGFLVGVAKLAKGANISVPAVKADSKPVETSF
jgi:hypothetical protein